MIAKLKELANNNTIRFAVAVVCFAVVGYLFFDYFLELLLGTVGLGAVAVAAKKQKARDAETISDEHESMADAALVESVKAMNEAKTSHDAAVKISKKTAEPKKVPPGFKKKKITSR